MKDLFRVVSISSKEWFKNLRNKCPLFCESLNKNFVITNIFLRHISWNTVKKRELKEIISRLSSISLIEKIAIEWKIVEIRKEVVVERKSFYNTTYKIWLKIKNIIFYIVLWEKKDWKIILISTFSNILNK